MKLIHLHAQYKGDIKIPDELIPKLPKKVGLVASVQYLKGIESIKGQLKDSVVGGQVLGCRVEEAEKILDKVDAFLYIGTGEFHPIAVYLNTKKEVYCFNPLDNTLTTVDKDAAARFEKKRRGALSKYFTSGVVGILVSSKNGQFYYDKAKKLIEVEKQRNPDKQFFVFCCNTIDLAQFQNFPFIQCWVNTACPRIVDEKDNLVNVDAILKMYNIPVKENLVN